MPYWGRTRTEGMRAAGRVLDAAEAASPVEAVEAVTRELGLALGATTVSFMIADVSGRLSCAARAREGGGLLGGER
jgi:hypothetical protein